MKRKKNNLVQTKVIYCDVKTMHNMHLKKTHMNLNQLIFFFIVKQFKAISSKLQMHIHTSKKDLFMPAVLLFKHYRTPNQLKQFYFEVDKPGGNINRFLY
jgi:hypothetical protein